MKQIILPLTMVFFLSTILAKLTSANNGTLPANPFLKHRFAKQKKQSKLNPQLLKQLDPYWFLQNNAIDYLPLTGGTLSGALSGTSFTAANGFFGNLYGTATSATNTSNWNGVGNYISGGGVQSAGLGNLLGLHTNGYVYQFNASGVQNWLGMGSYAYRSNGLAELSGATFTGSVNINTGGSSLIVGNGMAFTSTNGSQAWMASQLWRWTGGAWTRNSSSTAVIWGADDSNSFGVWTVGTGVATTQGPDNSNNRLYVTNAGNVGIGTASPSTALDVRLNSGVLVGANSRAFIRQSITGDAEIGASPGGYLSIFSDGGEKIRVLSSGDVGIGTTSPTNRLTVAGNIEQTSTANTIFTNNIAVVSSAANLVLNPSSANVIIPSGNVGISTASPSTALDVRLNSGVLVGANSRAFIRQSITGDAEIGASPGGYLSIFSNGGEKIRVLASGDVGIGTTSPSARLHVSGGEFRIDAAGGSGAVSTYYPNTTNTDARTWGIVASSQVFGDFDIRQSTAKDGNPVSAGISRMYFSTTGRVGIGTTNPATDFEISRNGSLTQRLTNTANGTQVEMGTTGGLGYIGTKSESAFGIYSYDVERIRISANGNIGIGTTSPGAYKLAVNGDVKARKLRITQTEWPDYIFHKNYPLQSLAAVENFIQKHQHLPGIPSASEVAKNGLDVGDTQALLLKKIEELTLYMIEQDKKIQAMEQQIIHLTKKEKKQ